MDWAKDIEGKQLNLRCYVGLFYNQHVHFKYKMINVKRAEEEGGGSCMRTDQGFSQKGNYFTCLKIASNINLVLRSF